MVVVVVVVGSSCNDFFELDDADDDDDNATSAYPRPATISAKHDTFMKITTPIKSFEICEFSFQSDILFFFENK